MDQSNLINNNVSALNGASAGLDTTNLVTSNLTRKQPFSSYSIQFDGTDYLADGATSGIFESATSVSVSSWMKMGDISAARIVISNWVSGSTQFLLRWADNTGNGFQFYIGGPGGATHEGYVLAESGSTVTAVADRWYNIVGTWDGENIRIYVDGVERGSEASEGSISESTEPNWIGRYSTQYMNGQLSNIACWKNTALTQDDILNIYNNGVTQDLSNFRITPTAWYSMDQSYTYFNGTTLISRDVINSNDMTGVNLIQENIVGNAPGSTANGTGTNLTIADLKGNMSSSSNNLYSINMADYADQNGSSGRSPNVPG